MLDMPGFPGNVPSARAVPPGSSTDYGTPGMIAVDSSYLYVCVAPATWRKVALFAFGSLPYVYASDGDANGVFYRLGVLAGIGAWTNPFTAATLNIISTDNTGSDLKASIVDRVASVYSTPASPNTIVFDLMTGRSCIPSYYSYRYRNDANTFSPTAWQIQGSTDNSAWTTLDTVSGLTPVASAWVSRPLTSLSVAYRYFRFLMTGNNNSGAAQVSMGEFELYGTANF